jgi:hypothetical protein
MRLPCALAIVAVALPSVALAAGPGTHVREAKRTLDRLVEIDPGWAADAADPLALAYLRFGALSPDFQNNLLTSLPFGHDRALSYVLLDDAASKGPLHRMFALGHLCHNATDNAVESFVVPTLWGSAPLGLFDILAGYDGVEGEAEGIVEIFGDLIFGDWDGFVDFLFDAWISGDAAKDQTSELFQWYCTTGAAWKKKTVDCIAAEGTAVEKLAVVEGLLGNGTKEQAKELVHTIVDKPLPEMVDLIDSPIFASLGTSSGAQKSEEFDTEIARFKASALVDPSFWAVYDDALADLGPSWALAFLATRTTASWPTHDVLAVVSGNVESVMQFLPDAYAVVPGLLVDEVKWLDAAGKQVKSIAASQAGASLQARVQVVSGLPLKGTVRVVVRKDAPGLAQGSDAALGSASADVDIDPEAYVTTPRTVITVPFVADVEGARGFYVDVLFGDEERPAFTTSWDRLWTIPDLDVDRPRYVNNYGTYGKYLGSLPITGAAPGPGAFLVKVRAFPSGFDVGGATVWRMEGGPKVTAGKNGIAVLDGVEAGDWQLAVSAPGWAWHVPVHATLAPLETKWVTIAVTLSRMVPPRVRPVFPRFNAP